MKFNFHKKFFLHRKMLKPEGSIFIFLVLLKLSKENEISEVLESFYADHAALYTAFRNIIPNELSFVFQKDGLTIYFLIHVKTASASLETGLRHKWLYMYTYACI